MEKKYLNEVLEKLDNLTRSPRLEKLRNQYFDTDLSICPERAQIVTASYKETEGEPQIIRRAKALDKVLSEMTLYVKDGDLFVGNLASVPRAAAIFPEYSVNWIEEELNGKPYFFPDRPGDVFQCSEETKRILLEEVIPYWKGKTHEDRVKALLPEETRVATLEVKGTVEDWVMTSGDGHTIPDYRKVLRVGIGGIIKEAEERMAALDLSDPDDLRKVPFYQAAIIANKAVLKYAARFKKMVSELAEKEADPVRKQELQTMVEVLSNVPEKPARTFQEAIQSIFFCCVTVQIESNGHSISFGRVDQYLYPYYKKDMDEGRIDTDLALDMLGCFWLKAADLSKLRDWGNSIAFVGNPLFQNMTLGGKTIDGRDGVNELSYLGLAATKHVKIIQPSLTVRISSRTPDRFLREAVKVIRHVGSMPSFYNDEIIIPAMLRVGFAYEDAVDYGMVGCVEPSPQGCGAGRYGAGFPNFPKWVELALNGGKDPLTGITCCPDDRDITTLKDFDDLMDAFKKQLNYFLKQHVTAANVVDISWEQMTPRPFLSSIIEGCLERGLELKQGGAKYDNTGGQNVGVVSAGNALATLKKVMFDDKILTAEQIQHALATNYEDDTTTPSGEQIRQILLNCDNKFGNDLDEPDYITAEIMQYFAKQEEQYHNTRYGKGPIGGHFIPSTATVSSNVMVGLDVGATADGRKARTPITEGTSAFRGTDKSGPTALINSYGKLPNIMMAGGQLFNVKITPSSVESEEGLDNWVALIRALFEQNGMQLQFNIVSAETLHEAKETPQKYKDLIVRVAGFSGYFVDLVPQVQDDIIERTEHTL